MIGYLKKINMTAVVIFLAFSMILVSCAHAKPPKPGPGFVWIKGHQTPAGDAVPGHWKYVGPPVKGKTWVPGHFNDDDVWVEGHWKALAPPKKGAVWVPGHHGPRGRWLPGHWRR